LVESLNELAARVLIDTYAGRGDASGDDLNQVVLRAVRGLRSRDIDPSELTTLVETLQARPYSGLAYSRREVARWFEVDLDEFDETPIGQLEPEVLYRHMYYENRFKAWFEEWDYEVEVGADVEGQEDFVPDVWATTKTLHGNFAVAVTLVCDDPPSTDRVGSMLQRLEMFAPKGGRSDFGARDIYLLVTPFKFKESASRQIARQVEEEDYFVVEIEGDDLHSLELAASPQHRLSRLHDLVEIAARNQGMKDF
jgi:hypothetical protein